MVLVECYNDETVLRALGWSRKDIRRMRGKGNVINHLKKGGQLDVVGLVDRDARSPNPTPLEPFIRAEAAHDAVLYTWKGQRLVVVEDSIEVWVVRALEASGLQLIDYTPARTAADLHRLEARVCEPGLTKAIEALVAKSSAHVATLKRFLSPGNSNGT